VSPEALEYLAQAADAVGKALRALARDSVSPAPAALVEGFRTVRQAAELLKVKPDTVLAWISKGRLRATKLPGGRDFRIAPADLEAVLQAGGPAACVENPVDIRAARLTAAIRSAKGAK
jgi:excisionase family DNA binding protein